MTRTFALEIFGDAGWVRLPATFASRYIAEAMGRETLDWAVPCWRAVEVSV